MRWISSSKVKQRTKLVSACLTHRPWVSCLSTHTSARLPSGTSPYQLTKNNIIQVNTAAPATLPCHAALHDNKASGADFSHTERSVWLHLTLVKVAGANWRTSSTAAYSHLEKPGLCFLDIFTAFILLPLLLREALSVM